MERTKIMIVEDNYVTAKKTQIFLEDAGYQVVAIVSTAMDAIHTVQTDKPDLILMDIALDGEQDGIEAVGDIRVFSDMPVIYMSAYLSEKNLRRARETEPSGFISKPLSHKELLASIDMALYKHRMERRLNDSEQRYYALLNSIPYSILAIDSTERVTFINPAAELLTGWAKQDAIGRNITDVFRLANVTLYQLKNKLFLKTAYESFPPSISIENKNLLTKDGQEIPIDCAISPIQDQDNQITGAMILFQDVSGQKKIEEERLKISRLESMSVFASGIAHEFNNILTGIVGNITLAKLYSSSSSRIHERLNMAEKACERGKQMTQQLLTFYSNPPSTLKKTSIADLIKDSALFALRGSNVQCEFTIPEDLCEVVIDEGQISQVVYNILINSDQAMPEGGVIAIRCNNVYLQDKALYSLKEGSYLKIAFTDQGIGILKEHLTKIFDPYFTTKQRGSGLGLSTCYSIIKNHGGAITVDSQIGIGTTFNVYLPAYQPNLDAIAPFEENYFVKS